MPRSSKDPIVAGNLKAELARQGRTPYSVATAIGYTPSWLYEVINGKVGIALPTLREVAEELGVSISELVEPGQDMAIEDLPGDGPSHKARVRRSLRGFMGNKGKEQQPASDITPEEAIANYQLIMSEPRLMLNLEGSSLSVKDMADIADFIRLVHAEKAREQEEAGGQVEPPQESGQ